MATRMLHHHPNGKCVVRVDEKGLALGLRQNRIVNQSVETTR